jgi:RNA-directed DNA polymerase
MGALHPRARYTHPNKPPSWVIARYFGQFNKSRNDQWVFGDRESGIYLHKFAWTRIVRHPMVKGAASPDDPALSDYWASRRSKAPPLSIDTTSLRRFEAQHGRCQVCGDWLLSDHDRPQNPHEWERWQLAARRTIITIATRADGTPDDTKPRLVHAHCLGQHHASRRNSPALLHAREPPGLA